MKYIITLIFLFLLLSCEGRHTRCIKNKPSNSIVEDKRCLKLKMEAARKGREMGFCRSIDPIKQSHHPNPKACKALYAEARKKCDDLPPPNPDDIETLSGSATYRGGKPIMIDGKPICP